MLSKVRIVLWCAVLFSVANISAADRLPAQLSAETFGTLIADLSEPEVPFKYANENFVSNEIYNQTIVPLILKRTTPGGVYIGVGPEQNLTYVAAFRPQMAFIIDIRRQNMLLHLMYKALFEMSVDRGDFVSRLFSRKRPGGIEESTPVTDLMSRYQNIVPDAEFYKSNLQAIKDRLTKVDQLALSVDDIAAIEKVYTAFRDAGLEINFGSPKTGAGYDSISFRTLMTAGDNEGHTDPGMKHSFLASEADFRYVRSMQLNNLIVPLVGDFGGPKSIRAVGDYVRDRASVVKVFYMSNVSGYLNRAQTDSFFQSLRSLPLDPAASLIRAADQPALGKDRKPPGRLLGYFSSMVPMQQLLDEIEQGHFSTWLDIDKISH